MKYFEREKLDIIRNEIINIIKVNILELGVQKGNSTKMFLDVCDVNDGSLTSIDIDDCSKISNNKRWNFIHSSDDNFELIDTNFNNKLTSTNDKKGFVQYFCNIANVSIVGNSCYNIPAGESLYKRTNVQPQRFVDYRESKIFMILYNYENKFKNRLEDFNKHQPIFRQLDGNTPNEIKCIYLHENKGVNSKN